MKKTVRINIPENAVKLIVLAYKILAKHLADGASSVLIFLNMAEMQTKTDLADASNTLSETKSKEAEIATESRNNALGIGKNDLPDNVLFYIYLIRDFLLNTYKNNEHKLGLWGFEVNDVPGKEPKVVISRKAPELMQLAADILAKHTADGGGSVLSGLNMAELQNKLDIALQQHILSQNLHQQAETAIQERNLSLGHAPEQTSYTPSTVLFYVSSVRDSLLGTYRGKERKLSEWGFNVDASLPAAKTYTIVMATNQSTPTPVNIVLMGEAGKKITVLWGDGTTEVYTMNGNYVIASHNYTTAGNYTIRLTGEKEAFLELFAPDCKITAINLPPELTLLRAIDLINNLLGSFYFPVTYVLMLSLQLNSNQLDQQSINALLIAINSLGTSNGMVNLAGGTNAAPSGQGIAAMNQLIQRGWTIQTN